MKISELSRRAGLAATALRYYEKAGLLPPPVRTASGYRTYAPDVVPRLAFIRAAQAVGLTIGEIREIIGIRDLGTAPCGHVLELIERRRGLPGIAQPGVGPRKTDPLAGAGPKA